MGGQTHVNIALINAEGTKRGWNIVMETQRDLTFSFVTFPSRGCETKSLEDMTARVKEAY